MENNEKVRIFNHKCAMFFENPSVYVFLQYGHQCIWENCRWNSIVEMLICAACRT